MIPLKGMKGSYGNYCCYVVVLYVDVGENTSLLEQTMNNCRYDDLDVNIDFSSWLLKQVVYVCIKLAIFSCTTDSLIPGYLLHCNVV